MKRRRTKIRTRITRKNIRITRRRKKEKKSTRNICINTKQEQEGEGREEDKTEEERGDPRHRVRDHPQPDASGLDKPQGTCLLDCGRESSGQKR